MNRRWRRCRLVAGLALTLPMLLVTGTAARAGAPTDQLKGQIDRVIKILDDPELKKESRAQDRRVTVRKIADEIFDFPETAKRSLGRHWAPRTPAERDEFVKLFSDLLERAYFSKIELYGGEKISYLADAIDGELATVRTKLMTKDGSDVPVDYRMLRKGDRWMVYDVVIEGISLIGNYRTQFNKIIQTSSYQELVRKMKTKSDELMGEERTKRTSAR